MSEYYNAAVLGVISYIVTSVACILGVVYIVADK